MPTPQTPPPQHQHGSKASTPARPVAALCVSLVVAALVIGAVYLAFPDPAETATSRGKPATEASGRKPHHRRLPEPPKRQPTTTPPPTASPTPPSTPEAKLSTLPPPSPSSAPLPFKPTEPTSGKPWETAGGSHLFLTPEFPVEVCRRESNVSTLMRCVLRVPMYIMVLNRVKEALDLIAFAAKVNPVISRNGTHEVRVFIQTVLVDNTGCGRRMRLRHPDVKHFESHAEVVGSDFNCGEWAETVAMQSKRYGVATLTPSVPLTFGQTQNFVQQDALERRGVPRFIWAHADAAVDSPAPLARLALIAATVRHPFCAIFSHYDIIAVFDAHSVTREVGDWDAHLWYWGDVDYYARCRHARLPWGEAGGADVRHVGQGSATKKEAERLPKTKTRFEAMGRMFNGYYHDRSSALGTALFDLPPKGKSLAGAWLEFNDALWVKSPTVQLAEVVSRHMGRWMFPYRLLAHRGGDSEDGSARLVVRVEYLPTDLAREDSPANGDVALAGLTESLRAGTGADQAGVYTPQ